MKKLPVSCIEPGLATRFIHDIIHVTMVRTGRREEGSGWGTRVYLWWIHVDIWQNQYNIVKLKNKIKLKCQKKKKKRQKQRPVVDVSSGESKV